ncbi:MAG TPA: polynucleotide kinase-phosphatase [Actinocrinis sp.]
MSRVLTVPELSLVVLVGTTGSGKSTFAHRHFKPTQIVSSDACRGIVSDDENDQGATADAFALVHHIAGVRLRRGLLTVVDATSVQAKARAGLVDVAREHDVLPVAIVLDLPEAVCRERNAHRPERAQLSPYVISRQRKDLKASLRGLEREGFRKVHVLRSVEEVADAVIEYEKAYNDKRELTGPFDVIGDVHGCRSELESLLVELGYTLVRDAEGRPVDALPPLATAETTAETPAANTAATRMAVFVGDLVDRGPDTPGVLRLVMGMVEAGHALCVPGNHENKLVRALEGRKVQMKHGIAESLEQLDAQPEQFRKQVHDFCRGLISHYVLDGGRLVVAHAGLKEAYHGRASGRVRSFALYGDTTGETDEYGLPVRYPWASDYRGKAVVLYGHTPVVEPAWVNNTLCLDTGCVFGGSLTALRYPERQIVAVPAERVWYEPARPLAPTGPGRDPGVLDLGDVTGRRAVETRLMGSLVVGEDNAAAALEVMSRFAVDPRWLIHLPPTMAPVPVSSRDDLLEHPDEAFGYFRGAGVPKVVCEEKHMGSRAVVVLARDADAARERFGVPDGSTGVVITRTGRPFFADPEVTGRLLDRIRAAATGLKLWDELASPWLALDCELLPWSAKAMGLLRDQYAAVGASARSALAAALGVLDQALRRPDAGDGVSDGDGAETGADVLELGPGERDVLRELRDSQAGRLRDAEAFTAAYGRYCWPTSDLDGVRLAPFQLLAAEGKVYATENHGWHLDLADRLCAADPGLFQPTRRRVVEPADPGQVAEAADWWSQLTAGGGEGMVVKPFDALVRDGRRIVQPGVKCRGTEYLRIIYGPEYLEPRNLVQLRRRSLGRKQSLALREYALGLESLERFVAGEPLHRVHEAVFAVLALESEPVDPRL